VNLFLKPELKTGHQYLPSFLFDVAPCFPCISGPFEEVFVGDLQSLN